MPKSRAKAYYFRLQREYDRTGIFTFGVDADLGGGAVSEALEPDTEYEIRVGTLTIDDPYPDEESIADQDLASRLPSAKTLIADLDRLPESESLAKFRTDSAAEAVSRNLSFLLGSCRYPGLFWKAKHADRIFGPMLAEAQGGTGDRDPVQFVLMVGDQIYADKANRSVPIGLADTFEEFQERYFGAFGSKRMRELLRHMPTYMILDDHEIEDNWTQDRIRKAESRQTFILAINAYMSYQWLHGPRNYGRRLFYDFDWRGYPFFVLDTRTQRYMDDVVDDLSDNQMLGRPSRSDDEPGQLQCLKRWLEQMQDQLGPVPKFIVTSSVFAPNPIDAREGREAPDPVTAARRKQASDSWPAFPETRREILSCIVEHKVQNVVFLSGDIHCSNVAELEFNGLPHGTDLKAFSITSSAFYWPFPFADGDPANFVHDSRDPEQKDTFKINDAVSLDYKARNFTQEDNFCRIDVDAANHRIRVVPYGDDGGQLTSGGFAGIGSKPIEALLQLAA